MHAYIHTYIHTYILTYIHTYIHTCECTVGLNCSPPVHNVKTKLQPMGPTLYITDDPFWLKTPTTASSYQKCAIRNEQSLIPSESTTYRSSIYITETHQEFSIHRLSAVSLLRSVRARDRGLVIKMAEDSSDNAFSFAGHAAARAAGTQSNSSQSIDTGGSDNSELRTQIPRHALVAPKDNNSQ